MLQMYCSVSVVINELKGWRAVRHYIHTVLHATLKLYEMPYPIQVHLDSDISAVDFIFQVSAN